MQYSVAHIAYSFAESWQQDIFEQSLFDIGFDTIDGTDAYIQTALLDKEALMALIDETDGVSLLSIDDCEDRNWNETWEAEHPIEQLPLGITIIPHCAFGAGHHETTSMMVDELITRDFTGKNVLDNGCGTGVLGIFAAHLGAKVVAVDIDDKSVTNTLENAALNHVTLDARLGDTPPAGTYDLILSNIHRNILLAQMPLYARYLAPDGELWLSGFYADDIPALTEAAHSVGLTLYAQHERADWQMLQFTPNDSTIQRLTDSTEPKAR